ncbi:MAG: HAD hydrolase-like protein, partial [Clostridia bacterium]
PLLEHFGFQAYFDVMLGSQAPRLNNKADVVRECLTILGIDDPHKAVLVGDTMHDQRGAEQSGIDFLAVNYGFGFTTSDTAQSAKAVALCADPQAVAAFLR